MGRASVDLYGLQIGSRLEDIDRPRRPWWGVAVPEVSARPQVSAVRWKYEEALKERVQDLHILFFGPPDCLRLEQ